MTQGAGKPALVTGASRGIGAAIARRLAGDGYRVFLNYQSNEAKAAELRERILADGGHAELCPFDVSAASQVNEKLDWIFKSYGPLSVLVNNAGMTIDNPLLRLRDDDLETVLAVNLKGAIYCTRSAARQMMRERSGSIIQISSITGEMGNAGQCAYAAAKAGLIGFSKSVAKETAGRQVRVNVITPGLIDTDMTQGMGPELREEILRSIPLGRFGEPEDVAGVVSFLASPASRYITGQVIGVNGGLYI
jgi:3-oxoacyl-[acyl-carrier protein] reductase